MKSAFNNDTTGQVQAGLLSGSDVLTLRYLNGNCSWRVTADIEGVVREEKLSISPQIQIRGVGQTMFDLKCVVDENVLLQTVITLYGELTLTFDRYSCKQ